MPSPLYEICQHSVVAHGGVLATLFLAGFAGGFTHCAGMCGPFAMTQTAARLDAVSADKMNEWQRLKNAAILPYHAGRLTAYAGLGILVSVMTQSVITLTGFQIINAAMLFLAGILFVSAALPHDVLGKKIPALSVIMRAQGVLSALARPFFAKPVGWRGYVLGLLLGFLPCGLLYSALFAVSAYDAATAALAMAAFGLGTVPALFMVSLGTYGVRTRFRPLIRNLGRAMMLANGLLLIALAGQKALA